MRTDDIPEVALAAAVIGRVVSDLKNGSGEHRARALADIEDGCLDYWIEIVASECDVGVEIRKGLHRLAA